MQGILNGITTFINNLEQMITGPILSLAGLFMALIILILSLLVLWRIIKLSRSSNLIIETIYNATGNDALDKALLGLTQLAREMLVKQLEKAHYKLNVFKDLGPDKDQKLPDLTKQDIDEAENKLTQLLISLKDVTSGKIKTVVQLLNLVFIPKGTQITITLQPCLKNTTTSQDHSGISLEIKDLGGRQKPTLYTIWGPDSTSLEDVFSLEQYYIDMLDPVMYSLALELYQRIIDNTKPHKPNEEEFQAKLCNYIGEFLLSYGDTHHFLYKTALWKFEQASKHSEDWSHPYENIGETYCSMGQADKAIKGTEEVRLREYIWKAILNFNKALKKISSEQTKTEELDKKKHSERKIRINMARTYMIIADKINISYAKHEISRAEKNWDIDSELDCRILYNLACWYETIDMLHLDAGIPNAKQRALRFIIYSLVRSYNPVNKGNIIDWVHEDPEMEGIRADLERLLPSLLKKLDDIPKLNEMQGGDFVEALQDILPISTCNPSKALTEQFNR